VAGRQRCPRRGSGFGGASLRVARVRIQRFRGFESASLLLPPEVVVAGEPRAGRSDFVEALRRVLDPRSTRARVNPLDVYRPVGAGTDELLTEVEVTLLDLGEQLEALLNDSLEAFDAATAERAGIDGAGEAVLGVRLCYRIRYDVHSDSGDHWVDFPARSDPAANSFKRVSRVEREALPVQFIDSSPALQLRAEGGLRTLLSAAHPRALEDALTQLGQDVQSATVGFASASVVTEVLGTVLDAGPEVLFDIQEPDAVEFANDDGSLAALLRALQPALNLDAAGPLPIRSHGSTIQSVFSVAEAIAAARGTGSGVVVIADDFGDGLDASSSEYMASLLHSTGGQSILTTRRPEVVRAFKPEHLLRFVRTADGRAQYQLPEATDKAARITRRLVLDQLHSALSARIIALVEGPLDVEGYGPLATRLFETSGERKHSLAASGIRLIAPPGTDGGITRLPAVAEIALQLGFRVRAVVDNDKPGQEDPAVARLAELCEQLVVLPDRTAVEAALVRGIPGAELREIVESLEQLGMPPLPDAIDDAAIAEHLVAKKILKKQGLGQAWVQALTRQPPIARAVIEALCADDLGRIDLPPLS
jgi:putative ATP-dependent endonuclease of the OLD family